MFCDKCGAELTPAAKFCQKCGASVENNLPQISLPTSSDQHDVSQQSSSPRTEGEQENVEELYKAFLGPKNQDYYLRYFSQRENKGKLDVSWHWPAFFVTFYWLLYRKMWLYAVIYFFLPYLVWIPLGIVSAVAGKSVDTYAGIIYLLFWVGLFIFPPLYANALFYKHAKKKISEVIALTPDRSTQLGILYGKGGTSNVALIFVLIFAGVAILGILAAIAIPAYSNYTAKAKVVEGVNQGFEASQAVEKYYLRTGQIPVNLAVTGFSNTLDKYVSNIYVNPNNAIITVTFGANVLPQINGKKILIIPSQSSDNTISWKCSSNEIAAIYLPISCR
ncbi:MAG: pilin [Pseudomonadota bacterium]|nr:pilin [Pseudomonadota bacterium]